MNISHLEELPAWKEAADLALKVFDFTARDEFHAFGPVKGRLEYTTLLIPTSVAKSYELGYGGDFLHVAKESIVECRSMLGVCRRASDFAALDVEISSLIETANAVSEVISQWDESRWDAILGGNLFSTDSELDNTAEDCKRVGELKPG